MEKVEKIIKAVEPYIDARGKIENYHLPQKINLLATITSKKGSMRANHYHPEQEQMCLVISGSYVSVYKDLTIPNSQIRHQIIKAGDLSIMPSNVAHTMIFLEDSVFLNLVNGERDHDKFGEHTIKYELVKPQEIDHYLHLYSKK
ncbi:hypothetical protein HYT91_02240 [Candidatus Pacearchaeota archaeon]|nr:hypothetical protein [Candidatus Pacearchaeota archaeon]